MVSTEVLGTINNSQNVYAAGITFDGTNFLSVYNDFTAWNPALAFGGVSTGITYSVQTSSYIKIGRIVFCTLNIALSSKGSATGVATITGLPFTVLNSGIYTPVTVAAAGGVTLAANYTYVYLQPIINTTTAAIGAGGIAGVPLVALTNTAFANTSTLYLSFFYYAST
jgi:hypothetical protein